ncbi:MAG: hypothetical protein ACREO0_13635 [Pseudoxanthomonas sp.]
MTIMSVTIQLLLCSLALFTSMLACQEAGRRVGMAALRKHPQDGAKGGATEATVFALLGLVVAFTFSGAGARFEARRALITEETNNIGTAYLRLDLLATDAQPALREMFRSYTSLRSNPPALGDRAVADAWYARASEMQQRIWRDSLTAAQRPESASQATMLLMPALNAMIDITTTRQMAMRNHPPSAIFILLAGLSLTGSFLVGHATANVKSGGWMQKILFAAVVSLAMYLILDLEFPRAGWIQVGDSDRALSELGQSMR